MTRLHSIEHVELWVEDALEVANCYEKCFGFERIAEANPETGFEDHVSVILKQGDAKLIITSPINDKGVVADFVLKHGDGVRDIAFAVDDVACTFEEVIASGARASDVEVISCRGLNHRTIHAFGDLVHTFIEKGPLPPIFRTLPVKTDLKREFCIQNIDHIAMCLGIGELDKVTAFYKAVLGFKEGQEEYVQTEYSGMNSRVIMNGSIKFPLQEPLKDNPSGPILEFLKLNCGPGAYHLALLSSNIYRTMRSLPSEVKALDVSNTYYEQLPSRIQIPEPIAELKELKILVDGNPNGYLMQVFTRSMHKRHTFYIEIIQRAGHDGFGSGNVRALFDSIEADRIKLSKEILTDKM